MFLLVYLCNNKKNMDMIKRLLLLVFTVSALYTCSESDDNNSGSSSDNFDRQLMLTNWADNIIIPALQDLSSDLSVLITDKDAFIASPDDASLNQLRVSWLKAYKTWQYVEMFNIGKAEEILYGFQMNVYPTNINDIQANISADSYDLSNVNNHDAVGFPAVDYMIYGLRATDQEILNAYSSEPNFEDNASYLSALINQMDALTMTVLNDWTTSYRDVFVNSTSNTATSATNKLTNDFVFYYEKGLRANKFGIPAGVFSSSPLKTKVEAFYNKDVSKMLSLSALDAVKDFFNGVAYNSTATGESFSAYLQYLNTINSDASLNEIINTTFNIAQTKIEGLDDNLARQVETDNTKMLEAYDALQDAVVLLKVDMIQSMNISIDYVDADGD
jgi:hypothetical protein